MSVITTQFLLLAGQLVSATGNSLYVNGVPISGGGGGGGVTSLNSLTNAINILGSGGISVFVQGQNIVLSGDQSLSGTIAATGSSLYSFITGFSGQANTNFATNVNLGLSGSNLYNISVGIGTNLSGNLTQSGILLMARDLNISGVLATGIANTGQAAWISANGAANTLSGLLTQSGSYLYQLTTGASGYLLSLIGASSAGVLSINGLSGNLIFGANGGIAISASGQTIYISGQNWLTTGAGDIRYYPLGSNPSGYLVTMSGLSTGFVAQVSGILQSGYTALVNATGQAAISFATSMGSIISGNLTQTGITLNAQLNTKLSSTGGLLTGILTISGTGLLFVTPVIPAYQKGLFFYDNANDSLAYFNGSTGVTVNVGQESLFRAINSGAPKISNGAVVYISGSISPSGLSSINLAKADSGHNNISIGVATQDIFSGQAGYITYFGLVHDINTSGLIEGQPAFLSPTVYGGLTGVAPIAPSRTIQVGIVVRADPISGILFVNSDIGSMLSGAGDVYINNPLDGQVLTWTTTGNRWENRTVIATGGGSNQTGVNTSGELNFTTGLASGSLSYFIGFNPPFSSLPRVFITEELGNTNRIYGFAISGKTTSGVNVVFTDVISDTGVTLNVYAKTVTGAYSSFISGNIFITTGTNVTGGGGSFDRLSQITNSEIIITGFTTGTISRQHVCIGSGSDYPVILPSAISSSGKYIGFRMSRNLTKLVTLSGSLPSENIDSELTRTMHNHETCELYSNGIVWTKVAGKSIPYLAGLQLPSDQAYPGSYATVKINVNTPYIDNGGITDSGNSQIVVARSGFYKINALATTIQITSTQNIGTLIRLNGTYIDGVAVAANQYNSVRNTIGYITSLTAGSILELYGFAEQVGNFYGGTGQMQTCRLEITELLLW